MKNFAKKLSILNTICLLMCLPAAAETVNNMSNNIAVGPQYDSTHVYVGAQDLDKFVNSFVATFGGQPSKSSTTNVLPVPSSTEFRYIMSPVGMLSVFAYQTPIPFPFGQERYGYLVSDFDNAIATAKKNGAEIVVAPFKDAIGRDAVIQWPGGIKMQLYWHFSAPNYSPLQTIPDHRIYISVDKADEFINDFLKFSNGKIIDDNPHADAGEIGIPNQTFRRVQLQSNFGKMLILVTDGHLPYPFGYDMVGFEVNNLNEIINKAKAAGATILYGPYQSADKITAVIKFPGNFIAEVHQHIPLTPEDAKF